MGAGCPAETRSGSSWWASRRPASPANLQFPHLGVLILFWGTWLFPGGHYDYRISKAGCSLVCSSCSPINPQAPSFPLSSVPADIVVLAGQRSLLLGHPVLWWDPLWACRLFFLCCFFFSSAMLFLHFQWPLVVKKKSDWAEILQNHTYGQNCSKDIYLNLYLNVCWIIVFVFDSKTVIDPNPAYGHASGWGNNGFGAVIFHWVKLLVLIKRSVSHNIVMKSPIGLIFCRYIFMVSLQGQLKMVWLRLFFI